MGYGRRARQLSALAMISMLSACGSGDGGGPKESPAKIMTPLTMDASGLGGQPARLRQASDSDKGDGAIVAVNDFVTALVPLITALSSLADATPGATALGVAPGECHPANGNVSSSKTVTDGDDGKRAVVHLEIDNCQYTTSSHSYRLSGFFDTNQLASTDGTTLDIDEVYDLAGVRDGENFSFSGQRSLAFVHDGPDDETINSRIAVLELRHGGRYDAVRDVTEQVHFWGTEVGLRLEGQVVSSALSGYLDVSTPAPIRWDTNEGCPYYGIMRYEGDGNIEVRYGESTAQPGNVVEILVNDSVSKAVSECHVLFPVDPV